MMLPLRAYMAELKLKHGTGRHGRYKQEFAALADQVGVTALKLYRVSEPNSISPYLSPVQAIRLERLTDGKVPCETTAKDMRDLLQAAKELRQFRAFMDRTHQKGA